MVGVVAWTGPSNPCLQSFGTSPLWSIWAWVRRRKSRLAGWNGNGR